MESRKNQIISLAFKLIQEKGFVAMSYDDLSKPLGVTKANIHYHFEKKGGLRSRNPGVSLHYRPKRGWSIIFPIGCLASEGRIYVPYLPCKRISNRCLRRCSTK
jgi:hypothetical protein